MSDPDDIEDEVLRAFRFYRGELSVDPTVHAILAVGAVLANHLNEIESLLEQISLADVLSNKEEEDQLRHLGEIP